MSQARPLALAGSAAAALAWRCPVIPDGVVPATTVSYYVTPVQPLLARAHTSYPTWLPCN